MLKRLYQHHRHRQLFLNRLHLPRQHHHHHQPKYLSLYFRQHYPVLNLQ
jgi:hypothetical protein